VLAVSVLIETLPLPEDPVLAVWASALNVAGYWAYVFDASWRYVFVTDELRLSFRESGAETSFPIGRNYYSTEALQFRASRLLGSWNSRDFQRERFLDFGRYVLAGMPGGRDELRGAVDPGLADLVDELEPVEMSSVASRAAAFGFAGVRADGWNTFVRIDNAQGQVAGHVDLLKPAAGMSQLAAATAIADLGHLERMRVVQQPDRRPAAILMADLESSSPLARRLSTAQYFAFGRRLARSADQCVVDRGGIVGRHVGDGIVAFFLAETFGSESEAAAACIATATALRGTIAEIATRSDVPEADVSLRFGLHWGATLYVGRIQTAGRSEVTALGDEMNEAARIEACATGGRTLASKPFIERLNRADAQMLGLDPARASYIPLAELSSATDKARRDAPAIPVCDLADMEVLTHP
jgi:class 3 adenylate cyclase